MHLTKAHIKVGVPAEGEEGAEEAEEEAAAAGDEAASADCKEEEAPETDETTHSLA